MLSNYELQFAEIQDNFTKNHDELRYKDELKQLKKNVGRHMENDDSVLKWIYKRLSQELSFITTSTQTP